MEPLVSICCITYNHAPYIKECIEGFLMQKTTFPIEILIHDDCSTDGTTEIIKDYEKQYPDLIFPLYEEENQYQKGKASEIDLYNYKRARGKYIAYCEGDDYWTDPLKLQKQVDFMEANPDYSVCFHDFKKHDIRKDVWFCPAYGDNKLYDVNGIDIYAELFFRYPNFGQPLTMLFRLDKYNFSWCKQYKFFRDTHEIYHLLCNGKGRFMNFVGGVYHLHDGGVSTSLNITKTALIVRETYKELFRNNSHDYVIKKFLYETLLWNHEVYNFKEFIFILLEFLLVSPIITLRVLFTILKRKLKKLFK